jgi:hypothetical protein
LPRGGGQHLGLQAALAAGQIDLRRQCLGRRRQAGRAEQARQGGRAAQGALVRKEGHLAQQDPAWQVGRWPRLQRGDGRCVQAGAARQAGAKPGGAGQPDQQRRRQQAGPLTRFKRLSGPSG